MGNQLVGIAPSQIYPVEHYLTDLTEFKFDTSLGSTRFFKVARAESQEGLIVVKVFAINDPTLPLQPYKDCLDNIRSKLSPAVNCLPFQRTIVTEKAGLIMREYVKYSLYDRISTRPFLSNIEKRWLTFQVLYALHQCHRSGVCHGDIKLENITVTSWNWVLLVDFASFKPTFLPEDNPADYSYFFDTSRRRTCYIAPERFIKVSSDSNSMFNEAPCNSGDLKPAMDIFSAGCALLELWNEGHAPFDLSQLLAYRSNEYSPQKHLDKIEDPSLKALLTSMIQRDPSQRLSAELYLSQERGKLFPEYFYTFLQLYMQIFSTNPILSPDEKISRLKNDIGNIFKFLHPENDQEDVEADVEKQDLEKGEIVRDDDGLVIITALVTSCIRGLHDCSSKLHSLEILLELASHANEETILDRILPYILFFVRDGNARVRVAAINMITRCLSLVKRIPRSDANIFPEYIFPGLQSVVLDTSTAVRAAYAKNIASLAEIAMRFLEQTQTDWCDKTNGKNRDVPRINYEMEMQTLHDMVQRSVSSLLADSQTLVKQTLMESGINKLCVFFGRQKANDILLSHMITFLNDKEDKELRGSFFDCIVGVSAYIGWHCSVILTPLLLQGLTDCSEFVTVKSIHAMASLTELGLITKPALCELVSECSPFLVHPSLWIRQSVAGLVSTAAKNLSVLDVQCKFMPVLSIYMKYPLIQIDRPELLLESLVAPIPRPVFDSIIKYSDIESLLETLKERQNARLVASQGKILNYGEMKQSLRSLFRRLIADGMTDLVEDYLLLMSNHLKKIHKHRTSADAKHNKQNEGKIEITTPIRTFVSTLSEARTKADLILSNKKMRQASAHPATPSSNSSEWNVVATEIVPRTSEANNASRPTTPPNETHNAFVGIEHGGNISLHERSYIQYRTANCSVELRKLILKQQEHYLETLRSKEWAEQAAWQPQLPPPGWRLRGSLVAHLHEHRGHVTKLAPIGETSLFASCSRDGFIRIWDCAKMEGKNIANRSKQSYKVSGGVGVIGMAVCENNQSLAAATQDGSVIVLRVEPTSSRMTLVQARDLPAEEEGCIVDVQYLDSGPQSVLVYATLYGNLVGWDLRAPGVAWRLENGLKSGVITSFCLDSHQSWLTIGTSSGYHIAWDLRFQLPIATIEHPTEGSCIRKVISHPTEHSWVISSIKGNNEISMWNLETGSRQTTLWASNSPPFSKVHGNNHTVCAMQAGCIDRSGYLLAGGTDQRVRFWDLESPTESYLAIPAPNDPLIGGTTNYEHRLIDGTSVIYAVSQPPPPKIPGKIEEVHRAGPELPPPGHRDCITDITLCKASQCFLLTSSRDGVIKVWK